MKQSLERPIVTSKRKLAKLSEENSALLMLAAVSLFAGAASGLVGATFRVLLERADSLRNSLIGWSHANHYWVGLLLVLAICAGATAVAAWLVRRFSPYATGSGIPHVEAVLNEELPPAPPQLIPVKFVGGLLAIGSGLALGREGPTVQMGASISHLIGKLCGRNAADNRVLLAAGAGAGLATAFNAPIAGMVFVLEELAGRFDTRITVATFGASAAAIAVGRVIMGQAPDFNVPSLDIQGYAVLPACLVLGVVAGFLGAAYNRSLLGALSAADRLGRIPVEVRAALIGAAVGLIAWFAPGLAGGGDPITQRTLAGTASITMVPIVFLLRFGMGPVSYASGTPGGLFAPMLVLGANWFDVRRRVRSHFP